MQRDILPIVKESKNNLFILGKAGVGKSTLIKVVKKHFDTKCVTLCPTGITAQNVNGLTIHSFFNLPIEDSFTESHINRSINSLNHGEKFQRILMLETLIIDEISMVNSEVFNAMNLILKGLLNNNEPFGGKRLILIGDIFQLPPVDRYNAMGDQIYFWNSLAYQQTDFMRLELKKVYRLDETVENKKYENILGKIRIYQASQDDLNFLNNRVSSNTNKNETTVLCTTRKRASEHNYNGISNLNENIFSFNAEVSKNYPRNEFPVDLELKVAIGAPIIFIRNDSSGSYKNGTRGKVLGIDIENKKLSISLQDESNIEIGYVEWLPTRFNDLGRENAVRTNDYFRHFPIILGFAMTIHRCQGMTMDKIHLDLGNGAFSPGQLYVGLSRLKKIGGLTLATPIRNEDVKSSYATKKFYEEYPFEVVNLNLSGAQLSIVDAQGERINTTSGGQLGTKTLSVKLFNDGLSIDEILDERIRLGFKEIQKITIIGHLVENINQVDLHELKILLKISEELEQEVCLDLKQIIDIESLTLGEIRGALRNTDIEWNQLKFIAYTNGILTPSLPKEDRFPKSKNNAPIQPPPQIDEPLFEKLRLVRNELARERSLPPYFIFNNDTLKELAIHKPSTRAQLFDINGVGEIKINEYGDVFLRCINENTNVLVVVQNRIVDENLFAALKILRNNLARDRNLPAFCVCVNDTLREIATIKPINRTQFLEIRGVGEATLINYGDVFIDCVKQYNNCN